MRGRGNPALKELKMLNKKQKKIYVKNDGMICPYYGSHHIMAGDTDLDKNIAMIAVNCCICTNKWIDIFTLTGILEE